MEYPTTANLKTRKINDIWEIKGVAFKAIIKSFIFDVTTMRIDFHTHLGRGDPWYKDSNLEEQMHAKTVNDLLAEMKKSDVDKCVVTPNYRLPHRLIQANFDLSNDIKPYSQFVAFAWLDPRISNVSEALEILVTKHHFRGLKLHPVLNGYYPSNRVVLPLIETAVELSIPIYIHTGFGNLGKIEYLSNIVDTFPQARIVVGHMIEDDCIDFIDEHENVSLETSYTSYDKNPEIGRKKLEKAVKIAGSHKIVLGSDWPMGAGMEQEISKITHAGISEEDKQKILGENALKILNLEK